MKAKPKMPYDPGTPGVDRVTTEMFMDRKEANLIRLSEALQTGTYEPQAVLRTWMLKAGYTHVVDADLKGYFDTIDHDLLMERIKEKVSDGRVLNLLRQMLQQGIFEDGQTWTPEEGSPQGSVLSPLLSNIYLHPLDQLLADHGFALIRYADDFVVLCRSRPEAEAALEVIRSWVESARLPLHPTKTQIVDAASESFDFLGYHFERG